MRTEEFVAAVQRWVVASGVRSCAEELVRPVGRRPPETLAEVGDWFRSLAPEGQQQVVRAMTFAAESVAFGLLAVLDGARNIDPNDEHGDFELVYVTNRGRDLINDPATEELHELYRGVRSFLP